MNFGKMKMRFYSLLIEMNSHFEMEVIVTEFTVATGLTVLSFSSVFHSKVIWAHNLIVQINILFPELLE